MSPLSWSAFERELASHPDRNFVQHVVSGIKDGFSIGFEGPQVAHSAGNMSSVKEHPEVVEEYLDTEVALGRVLGPFERPPCPTFAVARLALCQRKRRTSFVSS